MARQRWYAVFGQVRDQRTFKRVGNVKFMGVQAAASTKSAYGRALDSYRPDHSVDRVEAMDAFFPDVPGSGALAMGHVLYVNNALQAFKEAREVS